MLEKIEFTHHGEPVPYERMNNRNIWSNRVQRYLQYKGLMAESLKSEYQDWVDDLQSVCLIARRQRRYSLSVRVYAARDAGDLDNFIKCIKDAIQDAGLVWNDRRIDHFNDCWLFVDRKNPRIEFTLERRE